MLTPIKSIRAKCLDCSAGQPKEVRLCPDTGCPNFIYRFGKNPKRKGMGKKNGIFSKKMPTEEQVLQK